MARDAKGTNYAKLASALLLERIAAIPPTTFVEVDYRRFFPKSDGPLFIYADPPYRGREGLWGKKSGFDSDEFFDKVRGWTEEGHDVLLTEYSVPGDFISILDLANKTSFRSSPTAAVGLPTGEAAFVLKDSALYWRWLENLWRK